MNKVPKYKFYERDGHFHFGFISNISGTFREYFADKISPYLIEINSSCDISFEDAASNVDRIVNGFCLERAKYVPGQEGQDLWCMSFEYIKTEHKKEFECPTVYHAIKNDLQKRYGTKEGSFLANRFSKAYRTYGLDNCGDNVRIALKGNPSEVERYKRSLDNGCCGFYDEEFKFIDSGTGEEKVFMVGFNFGH